MAEHDDRLKKETSYSIRPSVNHGGYHAILQQTAESAENLSYALEQECFVDEHKLDEDKTARR